MLLLQNENILLRAIEPEDLDQLYKWENDSRLWIHGSTLAPYSKHTLRQYIQEVQQYDIFQSNQLRLIICLQKDQSIVGAVDIYDLDTHSQRAAIGVVIDEAFRQQGLAKQALELLEQYCFQFLNLHQLYAYISVMNKVSIDLFTKAGYKTVGILKDWIYAFEEREDVILVQLINNKND